MQNSTSVHTKISFYSCIIWLVVCYSYTRLFIVSRLKRKDKVNLKDVNNYCYDKQRFAIYEDNLIPVINKLHDKKVIWLHAASIGETKNALKLIIKIYPKLKKYHIIITSTSLSVKKLVANLDFDNRRSISFHVLPYDTRLFIKRFIDIWNPNIVIWNEQDVWPNILLYLRDQKNIKKILIQGRLSSRSYKLWKLIGSGLFSMFFDSFSHVFIQNLDSLDRFRKLGVKEAKFAGNLKYFPENFSQVADASNFSDRLIIKSQFYQKLQKNLRKVRSLQFVSTHKEDEDMILSVINSYRDKIEKDSFKILIAPRHPDKISNLLAKLRAKKLNFSLLTDLIINQNQKNIESTKIIIWNKLGVIDSFYKLDCRVCIIGGSFGRKLGGHNPFEPLFQNKFIIFGKDMANFPEIEAYKNNKLVNQVLSQDKLKPVIDKVLTANLPKIRQKKLPNRDLLDQLEKAILE